MSLFSSSLFAQSFIEKQDNLFQNLNKTEITTGVLYDRVYSWSDLNVISEEIPKINYSFVQQVWYELEMATYENHRLLQLDEVKEKIRQNKLDGKGISIGYIDYNFNSIDTNAFNTNALYFGEDSLLYRGEGPPPYLLHTATYPFISAEDLYGDFVKIYFDPSIQLTNTGRSIEKMELELLNTNQSITLYPNDEKQIPLIGILDSFFHLKVTLHFGKDFVPREVFIDFGNYNLIPMTATFDFDKCVEDREIWSGANLMFKGYDEVFPTQGKGNYRIFYRKIDEDWTNCASNIQKPIIIIDGFDPGDERKVVPLINNKESIWDLLRYGNKHLGDDLRKKGYDVIILNFPVYNGRDGGADYIERNAMVLVKLIQEINDALQTSGSSEQIVVVGPSMGGTNCQICFGFYGKTTKFECS